MINDPTIQIKDLLSQLITSNTQVQDSSNIKTIEKIFNSISSNSIVQCTEYILSFIDNIQNYKISYDNSLSLLININNSISKLLSLSQIDDKQKSQISIYYMNTLLNPNVNQEKIIENLSKCLGDILNSTENNNDYVIELLNYIIKNKLVSLQFDSYKGFANILLTISISKSINNNNFMSAYDLLLNISKNFMEVIVNEYNNQIENINKFFKLNDIILIMFKLFSNCLFKIKHRFLENVTKENRINMLNLFTVFVPCGIRLLFKNDINIKDYEKYSQDLNNIIINEGLAKNNNVISWTNIEDYDISVNSMKIKVLKFIINSVGYMPINYENNDFIVMHSEMLKRIINNIEYVINNKYENIVNMKSDNSVNTNFNGDNNYKYSILISKMIKYINKVLSLSKIKDEFKEHNTYLIKNILFPLLIESKEEIKMSMDKEDCELYSYITEDYLFKQKNNTIKSQACSLMLNLFNYDYQNKSLISNYALILLSQTLNLKNIGMVNEVVSNEDKFIKLINNDDKQKMNFALLILILINNSLDVNPNDDNYSENSIITDNIKRIFELSRDIFLQNTLPIFIQYKFIVFLDCYLFTFYPEYNKNYDPIIKYIFANFLSNEYSLISNECCSAISDIIESYKKSNIDFSKFLIDNYLVDLINKIKTNNVTSFFDVILEMINMIKSQNSTYEIEIFKNICERIKTESMANQNKDKEVIINKCFNILKILSDRKELVEKNIEVIISALKPLLNFMDHLLDINFDEDIICLMTNVIKNINKVPNEFYNCFAYFENYINKNEGLMLDLYVLINYFIVLSHNEIETTNNLNHMNLIFNSSLTNTSNYEKSPYLITNLFSIWFMISDSIPQNSLLFYISKSLLELNVLISKKSENNYYNFLGHLTLVLTSFIKYPKVSLEIFNENQITLTYFKKLIKKVISDYESIPDVRNSNNISYNIKLIVLSLCSLIHNNLLGNETYKIIKLIMYLLLFQRRNESTKLKCLLKKKFDCNFVDDENNSEENEDNEKNKENKEKKSEDGEDNEGSNSESEEEEEEEDDDNYNLSDEIGEIIKKTMNPYKENDEYICFKEELFYFKNNYGDQYQLFSNELSEEDKQRIEYLIQLKRIEVGIKDDKSGFSIPRKIVKVKRKNNDS